MTSQFSLVFFLAGIALIRGNAVYNQNPYNSYPPQQYPNYPQQQQQQYNAPQQYNNGPQQQYNPNAYQQQQQGYNNYNFQQQNQQSYQAPQQQSYRPAPQQVRQTTQAPVTGVASQFFSLDDQGYTKYGYAHPGQASETYIDPSGNQAGSYAYFDADGKEIRVSYVADENGFRIVSKSSNGTPLANAANVNPVVDTPEVAEAKAAHMKAVAEATRLTRPNTSSKPRGSTQSSKKKKTYDYEDELADW